MSGRADYFAHVRAEGMVYGTGRTVPYLLSTTRSFSPVLALRWLRDEALRLADRLDPDPQRLVWIGPAFRAAPTPVPDCPAALRFWATGPAVRREAREHLRSGRPLVAAFPDLDCVYTLSVRLAENPGR
ncbi:hypothetical protein ABZX40_27695 [Streptomyces sp. NPDC004610]|uniref:hypothetical protein n=1 Tax=unclassified Streptomyces TaxID=2593676 RepID=UPI0033B0BA4E